MIELPDWAVPSMAEAALMDFGGLLRPSTGARTDRYDRKGSRWSVAVTLPPMIPARSRVVVSRLVQAKREGLRIEYPLLEAQGSPGAPVVNGAGQAGTTLALRGLQPGYAIREGYWLSVEDADGNHYLHNARANLMVGADGLASLPIEPELRAPFADGAKVHLARPMVQGFVDGEAWGWTIPTDRLITVQFPLEEAE